MFYRFRFPVFALLGLVITALLSSCQITNRHYSISGNTMGTRYHITLSTNASPATALGEKIRHRLESINQQMSTYQADSEISRFNSSTSTDWFAISTDFAFVTKQAIEVFELSNGAFDPSIKPLIDLWGFGASLTNQAIPSPEDINKSLSATGFRQLELQGNRIRKLDASLQLDLSAIAKGYAVDALTETLQQSGYQNFLVEIGGEVRASGQRFDGQPWKIAIQQPDSETGQINQIILLQQLAVATSGDYQNFFTMNGRRYSHVIDPATGNPPRNNIASVTVISENCLNADALATALMVMDLDQGLELAKQQGLAVYYILRKSQGYQTASSPAFKRLNNSPL